MILFLRHQFLDKMVSFVAFLFLGMSLMTMKIVTGFNLYNGRSNINNILASSSSSPSSSSSSSSSHYSRLFASQSIIEAESMYLEKATQSEGVLEKPDVVYMVVYNPTTVEEGIHTMKYPRGSDAEILLVFEGLADCIEFSKCIKEDPMMKHDPVPTPTQTVMMENACQEMNLPMKIVPMDPMEEEK